MPISNPVDEPTLLGKYYETYVNRINNEIVWYQDNYPSENMVEADAEAFQSGITSDVGGIASTVTQEMIQNDPSTEYRLDLNGFVINAYVVYNLILNDAIRYNRIRLVRIRRTLSGDNGAVTVLYDDMQVAILSEAYILPFDTSGLIDQQEFAPGQLIQDEDYELLFQQLYDRYRSTIRDRIVIFESTICHSSCHSSCHGSRGRR